MDFWTGLGSYVPHGSQPPEARRAGLMYAPMDLLSTDQLLMGTSWLRGALAASSFACYSETQVGLTTRSFEECAL